MTFAKFKNIRKCGFRATLNFPKLKVSLNLHYRIILRVVKKLHLVMLIDHNSIMQNGGHWAHFELQTLKAKIEGVLSRSYCCYGNQLCDKIHSNMFANDWVVSCLAVNFAISFTGFCLPKIWLNSAFIWIKKKKCIPLSIINRYP